MMKCPNAGCGFRSSHNEGMMVHLGTCSTRTSRRSTQVPQRKSLDIKRRFQREPINEHERNYANAQRTTDETSEELIPKSCENIREHTPRERKTNELADVVVDVRRRTGDMVVQNLLSILNHKDFDLNLFQAKYKNTSDCVNMVREKVDKEMSESGFARKTLRSECGKLECVLYMRCPIETLRTQAKNISRSMYLSPRHEKDDQEKPLFSHPMSANIGTHGIPKVVSLIKNSAERLVYWRTEESSEGPSFVGLGQLYSDKTQTSLKSSSTSLYPLHLTLLNFHEEDRKRIISSGESIVAFLPVEYINPDSSSGEKNFRVSRVDKMKLLQEAMQTILKPLKIRAIPGFSIESNGEKLHCHFVIANYCCDIPEARDMLALKIGVNSTHRCHRCLVNSSDMSNSTTSKLRNIEETKDCRHQADKIILEGGTKTNARQCLDRCSLSEYKSFLESFPFVGCHELLDMYSIFTYEPLHNLFLGISKLLKELLSARLADGTLKSSVLKTKKGEPRSFEQIRPAVLNGINRILSCIQASNPGVGLRIDFSSNGKGHLYNGIFKSDGLRGMLEGADHRSLDQIMPFIAMFVDSCCGDGASTTRVFVLYSEIQQMLARRTVEGGWTSLAIGKLRDMIKNFKREAKTLYGSYQASGMGTPKFHLLDHICYDLERMGGLQYGDASQFEHSHVVVKDLHRNTSKRKRSEMDETVENFGISVFMKRVKKTSRSKKGARYNTYTDNVVSLVRDGTRFSFSELKNTYLYERAKLKTGVVTGLEGNEHVRKFISDSGMDATRMFIQLLKNKYENRHAHVIMHLKLQRVSSAFVSGGFIPTSKDVKRTQSGLNLHFRDPGVTYSQRIVSVGNYYNSGKLKQDCVLVEADMQDAHPNSSRTVWVAKVLGLFRVEIMSEVSEIALVQYFDVVESTSQAMKILECVNLRWARAEHFNDDDNKSCGRWFDIIPAAAIRGVVQVVSVDYAVKGINPEKSWEKRTYHINRFFTNSKDIAC